MPFFGYYFITNMLHATGWPRKQGLLKKEVVNTMLLDTTKDQMVDWAAAIGAGRPNLVLQMLALCSQGRDWSVGGDAPGIKLFIKYADPRFVSLPMLLIIHPLCQGATECHA